jgi:hypothetical protein
MDARARAEAFVRWLRSFAEPELRIAAVDALFDQLDKRVRVEAAERSARAERSDRRTDRPEVPALSGDDLDEDAVAAMLDAICADAEQADGAAREAMLSIALAFQGARGRAHASRLRSAADRNARLSLARFLRGVPDGEDDPVPDAPERAREPVDARGRTLTLGERKALARKPDRAVLTRVLADPHPDVVRLLLDNPRLTEDDVVKLASKRPGRAEVLAEIARSPRWYRRPRVRLTLALNPATPPEIASMTVGLLARAELVLVASATHVPAAVRALCREHLARRPPSPLASGPTRLQ